MNREALVARERLDPRRIASFRAEPRMARLVGVRDTLIDYVQPLALRLGLEVVAIILVAGYAAWTMQTLWR